MEFIDEQLWPGIVGNWLLVLALTSAAFGAFFYFKGTRSEALLRERWYRLGRSFFWIHASALIATVALLFGLLLTRQFEYYYVWQHTNKALQNKYIFASFWEGQEGSFLLWAFWHAILGMFLVHMARNHEGGLMFTLLLIQAFLGTMVLGRVIYLPDLGIDFTIGSNPFLLTREHPNFIGAPFTKLPDYLAGLDGRGLNPALQNYWMTIHPPTLFLGFALTAVPFGFLMDGLLRRSFMDWMRPALPWAFVGVAVLGGGILMGGAWAYEALSFGGFWVWDPVENASLVPWLLLTAGAHMLLIPKKTKLVLQLAFLFLIFAFVFVLYSTFLTRSGVLGDASVHSFTDLGLTGQLLLFLFFFMWLPVVVLSPKKHRFAYLVVSLSVCLFGLASDFAGPAKLLWFLFGLASAGYFVHQLNHRTQSRQILVEDSTYSRDFWMLVGSMILLVSGLHLTIETSKPVINKLVGTSMAVGDVGDYNQVQWWFGLLVSVLMGISLLLPYARKTGAPKGLLRQLLQPVLVVTALVLTGVALWDEFRNPVHLALAWGGGMAVVAAVIYAARFFRKYPAQAGGAVAHGGFGLLMLGVVVATGHQNTISENKNFIQLEALNEEFRNDENVMLFRNDTVQMGDYYLVYKGDSMSGNYAWYQIEYLKPNQQGGLEKAFTLYPRLIMSNTMGNVAEPATAHFLHKDIFTHVTYVDLDRLKRRMAGVDAPTYEEPQHFKLDVGDTVFSSNAYVVLEGIEMVEAPDTTLADSLLNLELAPLFTVRNLEGRPDSVRPFFRVEGSRLVTRADTAARNGMVIEVTGLLPQENKVEVTMIRKKYTDMDDFIIMKAVVFPGIKILWAGCFLLAIGSLWSAWFRFRQNRP
jgi:cytochrome c-type biogenesis protein CcmF